ncbi:MAG: sugar phosphate isomerase/epimerase family protein [Anaerolineae bacterium]
MPRSLTLQLGVKTDPVEYRFSYEWLFRLMAEEGVQHAQLGSFFEMTLLPDEFFVHLRKQAERYGVRISSVFTTHRELGGCFRSEPGWEDVTRRTFRRFLEIGALVGADMVGGSAGAVLRDQMDKKDKGVKRYLHFIKEMLSYAYHCGVPCVIIEPMSCLAEPPTLPEEIQAWGEELTTYHLANLDHTAAFGYCVDVAHGYIDRHEHVVWDHMELLHAALPYARALHLKNTDQRYETTFGFTEEERERGIIQIVAVRDLVLSHADQIPTDTLVGYLEIGGPKLGRDYSDYKLERQLRESFRYLREVWDTKGIESSTGFNRIANVI